MTMHVIHGPSPFTAHKDLHKRNAPKAVKVASSHKKNHPRSLGVGEYNGQRERPAHIKHSNLFVQVGGFSARFVELERAVQMESLSRTQH